MSRSEPPPDALALTGDELDSVAPFHLGVDARDRLVSIGGALQVRVGAALGDRLDAHFEVLGTTEDQVHLVTTDGLALEGPVVRRGAVRYFFCQPTGTDLVHELAESLRAWKTTEVRDQGKTDFLAAMSHELRTPLGAVIGMTELLAGTALDAEQRQYLGSLRSNAQLLLSILGDVLDISRIESDHLTLHEGTVDLVTVGEEVVDALSARAREKGLRLFFDFQGNARRVLGDEDRVRQMLANLVANAIKFTEQGHVVATVRARNLGGAKGADVELRVSDTGIGISEEDSSRIFERFVQANPSIGPRFGGSGLGLALVRSLAERMGGRVEVESELGAGSTFRVSLTLPLAPDHAPSMKLSRVEAILVMPKGEERDALGRTLGRVGHRHMAFDDLREAKSVLGADQSLRDALWLVDGRRPSEWPALADFDVPHRVVIVSPGQVPSTVRAGGSGALLFEPVSQHELAIAIDRAFGAEGSSVPARPVALSPGRRVAILLVDDHEDGRLYVRTALARQGHRVTEAADGAEAIRILRHQRFDLIISDLDMPVMDGVAFARALRSIEAMEGRVRTPLLALSAHALKGKEEECLAAGFDAFRAKPVPHAHLLEWVQAWTHPREPVLLVDDDADTRLLLRRLLEKTHLFRVQEAATLADGRDQAVGRFAAVVTDLHLPDGHGWDLVAELRRARPRLPIVVYSGRDDEESRERCLAAGATEILRKPVRPAVFVETLVRLTIPAEERSPEVARADASEPAFTIDPDIADLVPGYLARTAQQLEEARASIEASRFEELATIAHKLKGTGGSFGFEAITAFARQLEDAALAHDAAEASESLDRLRDFVERVTVQLGTK